MNISLQTNHVNLRCFELRVCGKVKTQFLMNVCFNEFKSNFKISELLICSNMEGIEVKWLEKWITFYHFIPDVIQGYPQRMRRLYGIHLVCFFIIMIPCNLFLCPIHKKATKRLYPSQKKLYSTLELSFLKSFR